MKKWFADIIPYIKDDLDVRDKARFERKLSRSRVLREELAKVRRTLTFVEEFPLDSASPHIGLGIIEKVRETTQQDNPTPSYPQVRLQAYRSFYVRLSAVVLFAISMIVVVAVVSTRTPGIEKHDTIGTVTDIEGVVLVSGKQGELWRAIESEELQDGSTIRTKSDARARLRFSSDTIYVSPDTDIRVKSPLKGTFEAAKLNINGAELISGQAHFDIATRRPAANGTGNVQSLMPFVVETANAQVKVRGTRFSVSCDDSATIVFVNKGVVDVFNKRGSDFQRLSEGMIAVIGDVEAARKAFSDPSIPGQGDTIETRPIVLVSIASSDRNTVKIRIANQSPFRITTKYTAARDNVGIRFEFPMKDQTRTGWSTVRRMIKEFEPGEDIEYVYEIPRLLQGHEAGDYYLQAVYSGIVLLEGASPAFADDDAWDSVTGEWYSSPVAVILEKN